MSSYDMHAVIYCSWYALAILDFSDSVLTFVVNPL